MSNVTTVSFVYAGEVLAAGIALPVVGSVVIALRFWIRRVKEKRIAADDWTILAALPFVVGMGICLIYGVAMKAVGYPSPPYPIHKASPVLERLTETTKKQNTVITIYWIIWLFMIPANGLIKISALILYRRLFVVLKNSFFDLLTKFMLALCLVWTIAFWFAQLFVCGTNFHNALGNLGEIATCGVNAHLNSLMISDLVTDVLVWLTPMTVIWRLNMSTLKKLYVTAIFSLAAVSLIAAIIRLIVELEISAAGYAANIDLDLTLTINLYWSMIESSIALIAACLPTMHLRLLHDKLILLGRAIARILDAQHCAYESSSSKIQELEKSSLESPPSEPTTRVGADAAYEV